MYLQQQFQCRAQCKGLLNSDLCWSYIETPVYSAIKVKSLFVQNQLHHDKLYANPQKAKNLFLWYCLLLSMVSSGQVTETYTIQTSNFDASHTTNTNSNYFAGAYNNNGSEIGTYANGSGGGYTGDPGVSIFRALTTAHQPLVPVEIYKLEMNLRSQLM